MKDSTKIGIIAGLWGAAAASAVWYVQTVIEERAKRKAIDQWKDETIDKIKRVRDKRGYSPTEIIVHPVSEILAEELKNWKVD